MTTNQMTYEQACKIAATCLPHLPALPFETLAEAQRVLEAEAVRSSITTTRRIASRNAAWIAASISCGHYAL